MGPEATDPTVQTVGNYDLIDKIAEGGMGTVYKARDRTTGETVAIKIVSAHVTRNTIMMKRFEQEYNVARHLEHPNIVRALDFGYNGTSPYLVMEFVDGESLGKRLERDGKIPEAEAIRIMGQVAQALHKAHKQGLVHRDIKPDNVLVTRDGQAKVADLGLVKELETDLNLTRTGRGLGTPHFMAPEQFRNAKNADARCDIYSMAATLYMMVTGELPFKSLGPLDAWMKKINNEITPPRSLVPALSERLDWAIRRAMDADPKHRPANCREFVEDLTGHSTRKIAPAESNGSRDLWYLFFVDDEGTENTVKGTLGGIRRSLKEGLLGDASNVRASRNKSGPFEPLRTFPEFRDLVIAAGTTPAGASTTPAPGPKPAVPAPAPGDQAQPQGSKAVKMPGKDSPAPTPAAAPSVGPMIDLGKPADGVNWAPWVVMVAIALAALAGFYLLPLLSVMIWGRR
jgi:serine/threonine protein kinase